MANLLRRLSRPSRPARAPPHAPQEARPPHLHRPGRGRRPGRLPGHRHSPQLGLDLQGGVAVVLEPTEPASDEALDQTIEIIRNRVDAPRRGRAGDRPPGRLDRRAAARRGPAAASPRPRGRHRRAAVPAGARSRSPGPRSSTTTTTTEGDGSTTTTAAGDTTTTAARRARRPRRPVEGQSQAATPVPGRRDTTTTTAGGTTTTTRRRRRPPRRWPASRARRRAHAPRGGPARGHRDPRRSSTTTARSSAVYQLGPSQATGEIVADADAELDPNTGQWTVAPRDEGRRRRHRPVQRHRRPVQPAVGDLPHRPARHRPRLGRAVGAHDPDRRASTRTRSRSPAASRSRRPRTSPSRCATAACRCNLEPQTVQTVSPTLGEDSLKAGPGRRPARPRARVPLHDLLLPGPRASWWCSGCACGRRCSTRSSPTSAWR